MPLIKDRELPTYARLSAEGHRVIELESAHKQDIRELHIGLYNMMPDAALEATERQFLRLVGASNRVVQLHIHPFAPRDVERSAAARHHVETFYTPREEIFEAGLDGLIITGANPLEKTLQQEPFWPELCELFDWADSNVTSTLCSCLASHAHLLYRHNIHRSPLAQKCWGVFPQEIKPNNDHPLTRGINTRFMAIHSRWNEVSLEALRAAELPTLISGEHSGLFMASSRDGIRNVYLQGHPEYDTQSLLKEYKREILRWHTEDKPMPPVVGNYFSAQAKAILGEYCDLLENGEKTVSQFPDSLIQASLNNSWRDTSRALVNNWIGTIYQLTHVERDKPFMDGVDPLNPLASLR